MMDELDEIEMNELCKKYHLGWCGHCGTISLLHVGCEGHGCSCNGGGCSECHDIFNKFNDMPREIRLILTNYVKLADCLAFFRTECGEGKTFIETLEERFPEIPEDFPQNTHKTLFEEKIDEEDDITVILPKKGESEKHYTRRRQLTALEGLREGLILNEKGYPVLTKAFSERLKKFENSGDADAENLLFVARDCVYEDEDGRKYIEYRDVIDEYMEGINE